MTNTDPRIIRATLDRAERVGVVQAATEAGLDYSNVYTWRRRRTASGGVWPTDADIKHWHAVRRAHAGHLRNAAAHRRRRATHTGPLNVDPTATARRIRALMAIGYRNTDIAAAAGRTSSYVSFVSLGNCSRINVALAEDIARAYRRLSTALGPSERNRRHAEAKGWEPPAAWDNTTIADPEAAPWSHQRVDKRDIDEVAVYRAMGGDRSVRLNRHERARAVELLTDRGESAATIAERLGTNSRQVVRDRAAA